jgi:hypothetical protein
MLSPSQVLTTPYPRRGELYLLDPAEQVLPEDGDSIQSPKHWVLKNKEGSVFRKIQTVNNVQKYNICTENERITA